MALDGSVTSRSSSASLPFLSSIVAPMRSPEACITSFSGSASSLTWSLTSSASVIASRIPSVVTFAFTLKVSLGVGTSSSEVSRVGIWNMRVYFPSMVILSFPVFSSRASSADSFFPALFSSFRSSPTFMHIFVGSVHVYSSKAVFGHSKSTIATRDGSMALSFIPSGSMWNVASSTSMAMADIMSRRSLESETFSWNMWGFSPLSRSCQRIF